MKLILWLAVILVLLTGCTEEMSGVDLYALEAGGQATAIAAQARLRATQGAIFERQAQATMAADATQGAAQVELELLRGRLEATRQAQEMAVQSSGATEAARQGQYWQEATRQAHELRTTAEAMGARATATTMALETRQDEQQYWFRQFLLVFLGVSLTALAGIGLHAALRFVEWLIVWQDRKHMYYETTRGIVIFAPGPDGDLIPFAPGQVQERRRVLPVRTGRDVGKVYPLTASGSVLMSPMERRGNNTVHADAIQLVEAAIGVYGEESVTVPGYRDLDGWSSSVWQRVIAALAAARLVETRPGVGTYVTERGGGALGGLRYLLVSNQVHLRPAPLAGRYE